MATAKPLIDCTSNEWAFVTQRPTYLALSGGMDSVALLHMLAQQWPENAKYPLTVLHINHQIHPDASSWQKHCAQLAKHYQFAYCSAAVTLDGTSNLEAKAREARYEAMFAMMQPDSVLLLGQHGDDQAETFLLNLKRGSGTLGLSGMSRWQPLVNGQTLFRPLLSLRQTQINDYANTVLSPTDWINDPSNTDTRFDRNFLRHAIIPSLVQRWPQWTDKVVDSMQVLQQERSLLDEVVQERLLDCMCMPTVTSSIARTLHLTRLASYSDAWQTAILRAYIHTITQLPMSQAQTDALWDVIHAQSSAQGKLTIHTSQHGQLHFMRYDQQLWCVSQHSLDKARAQYHAMLDTPSASPTSTVSPVALTYKIKPQGERHHKPIKQWYKLWLIPPWLRTYTLIIREHNVDSALWCDAHLYPLLKE